MTIINLKNLRSIPPKRIRQITKRSFMQRFTADERITLRNSDNDYVKDLYEDLKLAEYIDLDLPLLKDGLLLLVTLGLLDESRVSSILTDGTLKET